MSEGNDEKEVRSVESDQGDLPVVLQCSQCNAILGDSIAWVSTNDQLKSVTLHGVSSMVAKGKQLVTSTEGVDLGSTYLQLQCKSCQEVIGRIYRTTPKALDELRDLYSLSITKINSYQVGSMDQTAGPGDTMDIDTVKQLRDSITKTQVMVCTLNARVLNIETAMQMEGDEETAEEVNADNEEETVNGRDLNMNQNGSAHDGSGDSADNRDSEKIENGLVSRVIQGSQASSRYETQGASRHDNHRGSAKDYGKDEQMPSGKRGKPQLVENGRDSKRSRYK